MTDVLLRQTEDDGDIEIIGGRVTLTDSFETMAYLCLFGGNQEDSGRDGDRNTWWGNLMETDSDFKEISRTQHLLDLLPPSSANLKRLRGAAEQDLSVFTNKKIANPVDVLVTMPERNKVSFAIDIEADGRRESFNFIVNWEASPVGN